MRQEVSIMAELWCDALAPLKDEEKRTSRYAMAGDRCASTHLLIPWRWQRSKAQRTSLTVREYAVEDQRVGVDVEVQPDRSGQDDRHP
jgi:hypothetical protein